GGCAAHGGRRPAGWCGPDYRTNFTPCTCRACAWPHRPGGELCRWPGLRAWVCTTLVATHSWPRGRTDTFTGLLIRALELGRRIDANELRRRAKADGTDLRAP